MNLWITLLYNCYLKMVVVGSDRRIVLLVAEIPTTEGLKMIYKGYTIKRGERGYLEVADSTGNICGLFSLVREAKYFINKAAA